MLLVVTAWLGASCTLLGAGDQPTPTPSPTPEPSPATAGAEVADDCLVAHADDQASVQRLPGDLEDAVLAQWSCLPALVVTTDDDPVTRAVAVGLAARLGVPVVAAGQPLPVSIAPTTIYRVTLLADRPAESETPSPAPPDPSPSREPPGFSPRTVQITGRDALDLALAAADAVHDDHLLAVTGDATEPAVLLTLAREGGSVVPLPQLASTSSRQRLALAGVAVRAMDPIDPAVRAELDLLGIPVERVRPPVTPEGSGRVVWLVDPEESVPDSLAVLVSLRGDVIIAAPDGDPRASADFHEAVAGLGERVGPLLVAAEAPFEDWQLEIVLAGNELPGGGYLLFPDRRMVAMYGHPEFAGLGVLGEQGPAQAVSRLEQIAAPYAQDGVRLLPTFELITTLATAGPTSTGDYSQPLPVDTIRPWVEMATEHGYYVVLDFQPGRSSFADQVPLYEELLQLPNVGVALDPEWRLGPDQVHLRQIGSVSAQEVNEVAAYLAGLVREHRLPQKLLIVHQFRLSMIRDRNALTHPAELAVMIHMDGQGPIPTKDETYRAITAGFVDRVWWGWKNFYDEDRPTPTPEHTMSRDPQPVFVSYQ